MYRIENTFVLKEIQMSKFCVFFGNDYKWSKSDIITQIKEQALLLRRTKNKDVMVIE